MSRKNILNLSHERFKELEGKLERIMGTKLHGDFFTKKGAIKGMLRKAFKYAKKNGADAYFIVGQGYIPDGFCGFPMGYAVVRLYRFKEGQAPN